jgi:hypothetical protein
MDLKVTNMTKLLKSTDSICSALTVLFFIASLN